MTQQEYRRKLAKVADLAVDYVKNDRGYNQMLDAFNELAEQCGANKGINEEATIGRRKLLVQSVCIKSLSKLSKESTDWLETQLNDIAEDYEPSRIHRGFRRQIFSLPRMSLSLDKVINFKRLTKSLTDSSANLSSFCCLSRNGIRCSFFKLLVSRISLSRSVRIVKNK